MKSNLILAIALSLLCFSCSNTAKTGVWNSSEGIYYIPSLNLKYQIGTENQWLVASAEELPNKIEMFVADTDANVCIVLTHTDIQDKRRLKEYTESDVDSIVWTIIHQNEQVKESILSKNISQSRFLNSAAWKFDVDMIAKMDVDSVNITYSGYIFDGPDDINILIGTLSTPQPHNFPDSLMQNYFTRLQPITK